MGSPWNIRASQLGSKIIMQDAKISPAAVQPNSNKILLFVFILIGLLGIGLYANNVFKAFLPASLPQGVTVISQSNLEEKYGLHVNLVAVTAAGGMVDLRLKIINGEKAKSLLQDKKNFPALLVSNGNTQLNASEDTKSQSINFYDGGDLFLMFSNAGNAVKPGTPVTLLFGNTALDPINAR
jgi:hypothetical protein